MSQRQKKELSVVLYLPSSKWVWACFKRNRTPSNSQSIRVALQPEMSQDPTETGEPLTYLVDGLYLQNFHSVFLNDSLHNNLSL